MEPDAFDFSVILEEPLLGASRRLAKILSLDALMNFLRHDEWISFRNQVKTTQGHTPKQNNESVSVALLLQHKTDLFADKHIRDAVAKNSK